MKGQYFCKNTNCNLYNVEFEVAQNCPICKLPLTFVSNFTEFEKGIIENYPYVIAFPFKRMLEEGEYFTKFSLLIDVFVNTLKYNALILATEYFKSPFKSEEINRLFIEKLAKPYHGHWNLFIDKAIDFLEQQNHTFFVTELPFAYHAVETGKKNNVVKKYEISKEFTNKQGKLKTKKEPMTAIWALLYYRNEKFAHTQTLSKETYKQLYYTCYAILKDFLVAVAYCKNYPMYKADRLYYYSLMGTTVKQSGRLTAEIKQDDNVWLQDGKGNRMSLLPFFVQPTQYIAGANAEMQVLMYEGNTGQKGRMIFDSPESFKPEAQGEILNKFYDLLHSKQILHSYTTQSFTKEKLKNHINQINSKIYNELKDEQKLIQGIYQKREEAEVALLSWVGARAGLFLMAAEAGSGKTNLLWEIKRQYEVWGNDTLMLRASRFSEDNLETELRKVLFLADDFSFTNSEAFQYTQSKPLMVLLDGGNEHANPENLVQGIIAFLQKFTIGSIKVVLSWRVNTQTDLPTLKEEWDEYVYSPTSFSENTGLQKRHYWLQQLNKIELQATWNNYVQHPTEKRYRVLFTLNELTLADRPLADQLHNPLLLKLFLELYCGKELVSKPKGFSNFWAIWWKERIGRYPRTAEFIIQLALLMANSQENRLPLDALFEDGIIGKHIRNYQIDSPYQQLLNSTMLTQFSIDNRLYVAFTIESVYHYALCQHLLRQPKIGFQLAYYNTKGKQWEQAVIYYLWDAVYKNKAYLLFAAIKNKDILVSLVAKPLANAFMLMDTQFLVDSILKNAGDREWEVLRKGCIVLNNAQQKKIVRGIVISTQNYIDLSIEECSAFTSNYLELFEKEFAVIVSDRLSEIDNLHELDKLKMRRLNNLAFYFKRLGLYQKAIKNFELILNEEYKIYGEEHTEIAGSYSNIAGILRGMGKFNEALEYYHKALKIRQKFYSNNNIKVAYSLANIGLCLKTLGKYDEAMEYQKKALAIKSKIQGEEHPEIATSYGNIASILKAQGKYDEAMGYFQKGLVIKLIFHGEEHPKVANSYGYIASILKAQGRYNEAMEFYQKGLAIKVKFFGEEHPSIATSKANIGSVYIKLKRFDKALANYLLALEIDSRFLPSNHTEIAISNNYIGDIYIEEEEFVKAELHLSKAEQIFKSHFDENHIRIAGLNKSYGLFYEKKGELNRALENYQNAYYKKVSILGEENNEVLEIKESIVRVKNLIGG